MPEVRMSGVPLPERPDPRPKSERAKGYVIESDAWGLLSEKCSSIVDNESITAGDATVSAMFQEAQASGLFDSTAEALHFAENFDRETRDAYWTQRVGSRLIAQDKHQKAMYAAGAIRGAMKASPPSGVNLDDIGGAFRKLGNGVRVALFGKDTTPRRDADWEVSGEQKLGRPVFFVLVETEGVEGIKYFERFAGRPFFDDAASAVQEADGLADDPAVRAFVCRAGGELIRVDARAKTPKEGLTGFQALQKLGAA